MVGSSLQQVVRDIKSLKIQGAATISKESVKAIKQVIHSSKTKNPNDFIREIKNAKKLLMNSRPTEPYLKNILNLIFYNVKGTNLRELKENLFSKIQKTLALMESNNKIIAEIGAKKIKNGMVIFTHCHSSTVISILLEAKKQGKKFEVHNTETRPLFQGRKTAKELAKNGIKVVHYVDSAARLAIKNADIMLIGADAITSEGRVINKIGSELFAEIAHKQDIPVYSCTSALKFDPQTIFGFEENIEQRKGNEVWENPPKNVFIDNHAFEIINPESITGIITELGIYEPQVLVEEIRRNYQGILRK